MDEGAIRALAERQYAYVATRQVRALGITRSQLQHLIESGRWAWASNRVIRLEGAPHDDRAPLMLAVLDGGRGMVVARRAAAALWRLPGYAFGPIEVSSPRRGTGTRPTIGRHFPLRDLTPDLCTDVDGIPVLRLPVLLFQLAGCENPMRVERLVDSVCTDSPGTLVALHELLPRLGKQGRNGITLMRLLLEERPVGTALVASNLERRFETILRQYGEPPLTRQLDVGGHEWIGRVDFADLDLRALFEVQSRRHHTSVVDRRNDEARRAALLAAGWLAVEFVLEDWIWYEPARAVRVVRETRRRLRALLAG